MMQANPLVDDQCTVIDPCARVNCNHGRCEVDRGTAVCRCYQGYTGSDCSQATGKEIRFFFSLSFCFSSSSI